MEETGIHLVKLRKRKRLSQEDLAVLAGVSQATISRIEKQEQEANVKTLAKLARALDVELSELVPKQLLESDGPEEDSFFAFCENPFCSRNSLKLQKGEAAVFWESGQLYPNAGWAEVNFCRSCGEELIKECSNCGRRSSEKHSRYCIRCGHQLATRPTEQDWKKITLQLKGGPPVTGSPPVVDDEEDIPF